jgi:hypothetical protein
LEVSQVLNGLGTYVTLQVSKGSVTQNLYDGLINKRL